MIKQMNERIETIREGSEREEGRKAGRKEGRNEQTNEQMNR